MAAGVKKAKMQRASAARTWISAEVEPGRSRFCKWHRATYRAQNSAPWVRCLTFIKPRKKIGGQPSSEKGKTPLKLRSFVYRQDGHELSYKVIHSIYGKG